MIWNDKELRTVGDLNDAISAIARADDQEAADRFMALYRAETSHADANVGYLSGYHGAQLMQKIQRMFGVSHPIFGTEVPSMDAAFEAGKRAAMGEFDV